MPLRGRVYNTHYSRYGINIGINVIDYSNPSPTLIVQVTENKHINRMLQNNGLIPEICHTCTCMRETTRCI